MNKKMVYNGFDYDGKIFNGLKKGQEVEVIDFFTSIQNVKFYRVSPDGWEDSLQILSEEQMEELK